VQVQQRRRESRALIVAPTLQQQLLWVEEWTTNCLLTLFWFWFWLWHGSWESFCKKSKDAMQWNLFNRCVSILCFMCAKNRKTNEHYGKVFLVTM
jgi:hypothetical protein